MDKFLGFCDLLCSNSWNGAFCQYYPFPGKNKENHGLGLTCLNEAVKRYGGSCKIYVKEKLFNVTICIPSKNV